MEKTKIIKKKKEKNNDKPKDINEEIFIPPISELTFFKSKSKIEKQHHRNYIITDTFKKKIKLKIKKGIIPFGMEEYNNKYVLNIEILPKEHNEHNNIYSTIYKFEQELSNKYNFNDKLNDEIEDKGYYPNMRESKEGGFIIRTYCMTMPKIYGIINGFEMPMTMGDIKNTVSNINLELGIFWINENNYGILWYVKEIEVLYSI